MLHIIIIYTFQQTYQKVHANNNIYNVYATWWRGSYSSNYENVYSLGNLNMCSLFMQGNKSHPKTQMSQAFYITGPTYSPL